MIDLEKLKNSIRANFAISGRGEGLMPCDTEWEDDVNSAHAMLMGFMRRAGYEEEEIQDEIGLDVVQFKRVIKLAQKISDDRVHNHSGSSAETKRFLSKAKMVQGCYLGMDPGNEIMSRSI